MGGAPDDDLTGAFERAARVGGPRDAGLRDPAVLWAKRVLDARRAGLAAEPCPPPVLRRVEGLFAGRPRRGISRFLALALDSGRAPLAAVRGIGSAPRTMRYAGVGATVDLQVRGGTRGRTVLLAVRPVVPGMTVELRSSRSARSRPVTLDASSTAELPVPTSVRQVSAVFRLGGVEAFRIRAVRVD